MKIGNIMKQMQEVQEQLAKTQQEHLNARFEGEAGAGLVKVVVDGNPNIISVEMDPSTLQESRDIISALFAAAANAAISKSKKAMESKMSGLTSGLKLPDGLNSLLGG